MNKKINWTEIRDHFPLFWKAMNKWIRQNRFKGLKLGDLELLPSGQNRYVALPVKSDWFDLFIDSISKDISKNTDNDECFIEAEYLLTIKA